VIREAEALRDAHGAMGAIRWPKNPIQRLVSQALLSDEFLDDVPMHVGEPAVDAIVAECELGVIDPQLAQDRRVNVVNFRGILAIQRLVAPLVALAMRDAPLDAAAAKPVGEDIRIVIAAFSALR